MAEIEDGWVLFSLQGQQYGLSIKPLQQMVVLPEIVRPPTYPACVKGMLPLRGCTVPVIDLRQRLGMKSSESEESEFLELLARHKQDHIDWLEELFRSVREQTVFTLATDPRKCAFGKWYEQFETTNTVLSFHLRKFDAPHRRIHGFAEGVTRLVAAGKKLEAEAQIEKARDTDLAEMIQLFDETRAVITAARREVVLVMDLSEDKCGFLVDEVCAVRDLPADEIQPVRGIIAGGASEIVSVGVAEVDGRPTVFLRAEELARGLGPASAA